MNRLVPCTTPRCNPIWARLPDIEPAINGGRIADSDIHPDDPSVIYVGVGSGGVWRTENAGTTWTPGPVR